MRAFIVSAAASIALVSAGLQNSWASDASSNLNHAIAVVVSEGNGGSQTILVSADSGRTAAQPDRAVMVTIGNGGSRMIVMPGETNHGSPVAPDAAVVQNTDRSHTNRDIVAAHHALAAEPSRAVVISEGNGGSATLVLPSDTRAAEPAQADRVVAVNEGNGGTTTIQVSAQATTGGPSSQDRGIVVTTGNGGSQTIHTGANTAGASSKASLTSAGD